MSLLIVGCGHIGTRVAHLEQATGRHVQAWVRTTAAVERLRVLQIAAHAVDLDVPESFPGTLAGDSSIYYFAPPPSQGVTDPRLAHFTAWLSRQAARPARIVLISTTGVYGDCRGDWIDEHRPPHPQIDRARRRLAAEETLRAYAAQTAVPIVILRVAGIYGPELLPTERLQRREPVLHADESPWSNRIHAHDLATACVAAMHHPRPAAVYNVTDGHPSTMTDYFNRVADALGLPRPPVIGRAGMGAALSPGMQSYLAESKRIDNRRLREELGVTLKYPDLAQGLAALAPDIVSNRTRAE